MFLRFKIDEPKFRKVEVFNLNWTIFGDVTPYLNFWFSISKFHFSVFPIFHLSSFFNKYFSIQPLRSSYQVNNAEHFHFRHSCTLQFLLGASFLLLSCQNVRSSKTSRNEHDYCWIIKKAYKWYHSSVNNKPRHT